MPIPIPMAMDNTTMAHRRDSAGPTKRMQLAAPHASSLITLLDQ